MKIAISSAGKELSDDVSELFGRCPFFVIVDVEDGEIKKTEAFENKSENQAGGAGISASKFLAQKEVDVVIAKSIGPRAMDVLNQFKIEVHSEEGSAKNIIQKIITKKS